MEHVLKFIVEVCGGTLLVVATLYSVFILGVLIKEEMEE